MKRPLFTILLQLCQMYTLYMHMGVLKNLGGLYEAYK